VEYIDLWMLQKHRILGAGGGCTVCAAGWKGK